MFYAYALCLTSFCSVNFVHNISITIACRRLVGGQEAAINVCVRKASTQYATGMALMEQLWRLLTRNI